MGAGGPQTRPTGYPIPGAGLNADPGRPPRRSRETGLWSRAPPGCWRPGSIVESSRMPPHEPAALRSRPRGAAARALAALALIAAGLGCDRGAGVTGSGTIELDEVDVASQVGGRLQRPAGDEGSARAGRGPP